MKNVFGRENKHYPPFYLLCNSGRFSSSVRNTQLNHYFPSFSDQNTCRHIKSNLLCLIVKTLYNLTPFCLSDLPNVGPLLFALQIYLFIYLFLAALGLRCCTWAFSSCGEWGLLFVAVHGLLVAVASLAVVHGLQALRLQQLQHAGSVGVAHGLSCSAACGIFPDQGSNPCPLHWQADS